MARPTKYIPGIHDQWARSLAMEGLIDQQIADRMGVARSTIKKWEKEFPEFSDALKTGKEPADAKVEQSLYKRALGYTEKEKKILVEMDKDGNQKPARIETTDKHISPDVTAQIFWLKNRRPDLWRDQKIVEATGKNGEPLIPKRKIDVSKLTPEQQEALLTIGMQLEEGNE